MRSLGTLALALSSGACFATRNDVRILQGDVLSMRAEVARGDSARARQLQQIITSLTSTLASISDSVRDVNARLGRFQGDTRQEMYAVQQMLLQIQELTGQSQRRLQDLRAEVEERNRQMPVAAPPTPGDTTKPPPVATPPREGPNTLWQLGNDQMRRGGYGAARAAFAELVQSYPESDLAPDAQYWIAEMLNNEGKIAESDSAYREVVAKYPKSAKAATAAYKLALSLDRQRKCADARAAMDKVIRDYPQSDVAALAKEWRCTVR